MARIPGRPTAIFITSNACKLPTIPGTNRLNIVNVKH